MSRFFDFVAVLLPILPHLPSSSDDDTRSGDAFFSQHPVWFEDFCEYNHSEKTIQRRWFNCLMAILKGNYAILQCFWL